MQYDCIFLDSIIYKKPFSKNLINLMESNQVVIADDFYETAEGFFPLMNDRQDAVFRYNLQVPTRLHATGHCQSTKGISGCEDSRRTIRYLLDISHCRRICVATANPLLIEWIVSLGNSAIDIYDINNDTLCTPQTYAAQEESLHMYRSDDRNLAPVIPAGATIYSRDNTAYILGKDINTGGGEGDLFELETPGSPQNSSYVAKIFLHVPSDEKVIFLKNLIAEAKRLNLSWCTFPVDLLYSEQQGSDRTVVGILMNKTDTPTLKTVGTIMVGDDIDPEVDDWDHLRRSELIRFICQIISQSLFLHTAGGFIPIDYNAGNLSVPVKRRPVIFYDTDSFVFRRFFGGVVNDSYYTKENYDVSKKTDVIMMAYENLCKLAFTVLALGYEPLTDKGYVFAPKRNNQKHEYVKSYFPPDVFAYLDSVFLCREEASPYHLHALLFRAAEELKNNPDNDITIAEMRRRARPEVFGAAPNTATSVMHTVPSGTNTASRSTQQKSAPAAAVPAGGSYSGDKPARPGTDADIDSAAKPDSAKVIPAGSRRKSHRASRAVRSVVVILLFLLAFIMLSLAVILITNALGWTDVPLPFLKDLLNSADLSTQLQTQIQT